MILTKSAFWIKDPKANKFSFHFRRPKRRKFDRKTIRKYIVFEHRVLSVFFLILAPLRNRKITNSRKHGSSKVPFEAQSLCSCFFVGFLSFWCLIFVDFRTSRNCFWIPHHICRNMHGAVQVAKLT